MRSKINSILLVVGTQEVGAELNLQEVTQAIRSEKKETKRSWIVKSLFLNNYQSLRLIRKERRMRSSSSED